MHQAVIDIFDIGIVRNREVFLHDDATCIDVMIQEKCRDTRLRLAIDNGPIDGCSTTILGQQGGMHIERAIFRHGPHHLG